MFAIIIRNTFHNIAFMIYESVVKLIFNRTTDLDFDYMI